jgi:hypothetical protein
MRNAFISLVAAVCLAGCGGGAPSRPTPTPTPTPTPAPPPPAAAAACGALGVTAPPSLAIVNGAECSAAASPVVLLNMRHAQGFALGACSGTIIAPRAILTAAHCLDEEVGTVRVWLGAGEEIVAESFAFHPSYSQSNGLDVGVVLMSQDLPRQLDLRRRFRRPDHGVARRPLGDRRHLLRRIRRDLQRRNELLRQRPQQQHLVVRPQPGPRGRGNLESKK